VEVKSLSEILYVLRRSECAEGPFVYRKLSFILSDTAWAAPYLDRISGIANLNLNTVQLFARDT